MKILVKTVSIIKWLQVAGASASRLLAFGFILGCTEPELQANHSKSDDGLVSQNTKSELVVSNYPLYLLAKAATQGVEMPVYLLAKQEAGHHMALKPSAHKKIQSADRIYWFGEQLETPLVKVLGQSNNQNKSMSLLSKVKPLHARDSRFKSLESIDPHVWLDPERAKRIVEFIAQDRAIQYPEQKQIYLDNSLEFSKRMDAAIDKVQKQIESSENKGNQNRPYFAYHDAYQYLENVLPMQIAGTLVSDPDLPVSAKQLYWLTEQRKTIRENLDSQNESVCVLSENHASKKALEKLKPFHLVQIDESLSKYDDFVSAWEALATEVVACLYKK